MKCSYRSSQKDCDSLGNIWGFFSCFIPKFEKQFLYWNNAAFNLSSLLKEVEMTPQAVLGEPKNTGRSISVEEGKLLKKMPDDILPQS